MYDALETFPAALVSSFSLVGLAEMGDKSQLVCMTLAARYNSTGPVLFGAMAAFSVLNLIAVVFGTVAAHWLPETVVISVVGILFLLFGVHALLYSDDGAQVLPDGRRSHSLFFSTLLLIMLAETGDKTQIAVAGLGSTLDPAAVWLGATLALGVTSGLGVLAGRTVMQRISVSLLHKVSGGLFVLFGLLAFLRLASV